MKYAVVFGGASFEHEISIVSAVVLKSVLKAELNFIFVSGEADFYLINPADMRAKFFSSGGYKKSARLILKKGGFYELGGMLRGEKKLDFDCAINLIHGADGEDGKIAALFDFYGVKYIGPGIEASALSFNKSLTKMLAKSCGVKTMPYQALKRGDRLNMDLPAILKPARLGSSIGVAIVGDISELDYALDVAFEFDDLVIAEPFVSGIREFNLAGFRLRSGDGDGDFEFSIIEEPSKEEFLDFERKYLDFSAAKADEASIDDGIKTAMKQAFMRVYDAGGFDGALIRCDFFYKDGEIYLNEINPNPGSLANYLFADFTASLNRLAKSIKEPKKIEVKYNFINKITSDKGGKLR